MNLKQFRYVVLILYILNIVLCVALNLIPTGNFIGAPFITFYIFCPLLIIQSFLTINAWQKKNGEKLTNSLISVSIITIIFLYLFFDYYKN
jgi:hypothetical protein